MIYFWAPKKSSMKKILLNFLAVSILLFQLSSCKKIAKALFGGFDQNVPDIQVTLPAVPLVSPFEIPLGSYSYKFNLDSIVRSKTGGVFGANDVSSIKIKQLSININNADPLNNLQNFQSVRVTIKSNTNSTPTELFSVMFPDMYADTFTTPGNNTELLSYLKGSDIVYDIYGKNRRITTKPLNLVISVIIRAG